MKVTFARRKTFLEKLFSVYQGLYLEILMPVEIFGRK